MSALLAKYEAYLLTAVACLVAGFIAGWTVHGWEMRSSQLHVVTAEAKHVIAVTQKQSQITAAVEAPAVARQQRIHATYAQLQREVPTHVTPEVDRQYPVSDRLVGVLDRALAVPSVPDAASRPDDTPAAASPLTESDIGAWATAVIETCTSTRQQLIDLQTWVKAQASGRLPKETTMVEWEKMVEQGEAEMVGGVLYKDRKEVGRLVEGQFVSHAEAQVEAAAAANPAVAEDVALAGGAAAVAAAEEAPAPNLEPPPERPAVDAAAMLGD